MSAAARRLPSAERRRRAQAFGDGQATTEERPTVRQTDWTRTDLDASVKPTDPGLSCTQRYYADLSHTDIGKY